MPDDTKIDDAKGDEREDAPRKERVLHTRVPAVLEDELKRLATNLKMPVSNVVRAILEDAIEAVEVVGVRAEDELKGFVTKLSEQRAAIREGASSAGRTASKARDARNESASPPAPPVAKGDSEGSPGSRPDEPERSDARALDTRVLDDVIGFDRLTLRRDSTCAVCGKALARGAEAARGIRDGGPSVLVCSRCAEL
jgi:predicted DNA-binding protein